MTSEPSRGNGDLSRTWRSRERPGVELGAEPKAMATLSRTWRSRERPGVELGAEPKAMATLSRTW
ncbi:hypothetical protein [Paenibacillus sp. FSL K6-1318]|uniref:hypothetical protein n=1 Tax=Paenibacillus sp. FSL K6-1318 TaxID=2975291 RepID=UPI0030ED41FA